MARLFTADYSTRDFSQWDQIAGAHFWGDQEGYDGRDYQARIVSLDKDCGYGARYEIRHGDVAAGGVERSMAFGGESSDAAVGGTYWFAWSTMFDETFPLDAPDAVGPSGPDGGWALQMGFQGEPGGIGSAWGVGWPDGSPPNFPESKYGKFYLQQCPSTGHPDEDVYNFTPVAEFDIDPGVWHDFKIQIYLDNTPGGTDGWIRLWHNNIRQTLYGDVDTFYCQTAHYLAEAVRPEQGLYWGSACSAKGTGIVYHTGYRMADSEDGL